MNDDQTSIKTIVNAIEAYYSGRPPEHICEEHEIGLDLFDRWLGKYKHITFEIMELKLENERLRRMFVDLSLKQHTLNSPSSLAIVS